MPSCKPLNHTMSHPLHPLTFPLHGSRLIEASAGTGKTWTIAALYLRLVLGHGNESGFARPLTPQDILVMTFTRAATRELGASVGSVASSGGHSSAIRSRPHSFA